MVTRFPLSTLVYLCFALAASCFLVDLRVDAQDDELLSTPESPVVLVVAPSVFSQALSPWIEYRQKQGYDVMTLPLAAKSTDGSVDLGVQIKPIATPDEIRAKIVKVAATRPIAAVLIVGDGAPTINAKYGWRDVVPAPRVPARVVQIFGSEDKLASDAYYVDFDGDGAPDAPIGRIPVETTDELQRMIDKIIRYETESPVGNWMRRVNIIAGPNGLDLRAIGSEPGSVPTGANVLSGVAAIVDSVVTQMARRLFSEYLPQDFSTSLTQFSLQSPFCPYPPDFQDVFIERANEGALFLVYLGHGRVFGLDRFESAEGKNYGVFEIEDCPKLDADGRAPIACFFSCYAGAFDASERSLAEEVALTEKGPIASIAASRRTAPYGMCVLGSALLENAFRQYAAPSSLQHDRDRVATLGEIYLGAQRSCLDSFKTSESEDDNILFDDEEEADETTERRWKPVKRNLSEPGAQLEWLNERLAQSLEDAEANKKKNAEFRLALDRAAALFDPTANRLEDQAKDHIAEFNLFGDPLLRVKFPTRVDFDAPEIAYSSESLLLAGSLPVDQDAEAIVQAELLLADYRTTVRAPKRNKYFVESDEARDDYNATYRAANQFVVDAVRAKTNNGEYRIAIKIPNDFSGECVVRIAAIDDKNYYVGSKRLLIRPRSRTE